MRLAVNPEPRVLYPKMTSLRGRICRASIKIDGRLDAVLARAQSQGAHATNDYAAIFDQGFANLQAVGGLKTDRDARALGPPRLNHQRGTEECGKDRDDPDELRPPSPPLDQQFARFGH